MTCVDTSQGRSGSERETDDTGHRRQDTDAGDEVPEVDRNSRPVTIQQEYVYHTDLGAPTAARVVTGQLPTSATSASHVTVICHRLSSVAIGILPGWETVPFLCLCE